MKYPRTKPSSHSLTEAARGGSECVCGCVSTYAREEDMPGVLALLHVNERSREADSQGLHRKGEEGSDGSYLPGWPIPRLMPKDYHTGQGLERGLEIRR